MVELGIFLLLCALGGLVSGEGMVTFLEDDIQISYGAHVHLKEVSLTPGIHVVLAQEFQVHHKLKLMKNSTRLVVLANEITSTEHVNLHRVANRITLCGNVDPKIKNYRQDCKKVLREYFGQEKLEHVVALFLNSVESVEEKTAMALKMNSMVENVEQVRELTLQYLLSKLKTNAGKLYMSKKSEEHDLLRDLEKSKKALGNKPSILNVKNKFLQGLSFLIDVALDSETVFDTVEIDLDIFHKIEKQNLLWNLFKRSSQNELLDVLLKEDLTSEFYPTITEWDIFSNALFSYAWHSSNYVSNNKILQEILQEVKKAFHLRSLIISQKISVMMPEKSNEIPIAEAEVRHSVQYVIEKVPIMELTGPGFRNRVKPNSNTQFGKFSYHGIESFTVSIDGIDGGEIDISTLNMFTKSTEDYKEILSGPPAHYKCENREACQLVGGQKAFSPFTDWIIKLKDEGYGTLTAHDIVIDFVFSVRDTRKSNDETVMRKRTKHKMDDLKAPFTHTDFLNETVDPKSIPKGYEEDYEFIKNKYGYHSPIYQSLDILVATDLDQMNALFENLHKNGKGVVTYFETPMFNYENESCTNYPNIFAPPDFRNLLIMESMRMVATLKPPKFYFLKNNDNTVRITWEFDQASYMEYVKEVLPCDDLGPWPMPSSNQSDSIAGATIEAYIPLKILHGTVSEGEDSGGIILDLKTSAFQPEHLTYECENCEEYMFEAIKSNFIDFMSEIYLTTIHYNPAVTPKVVRPSAFSFLVACTYCNEDVMDKGYLVVLVCTQASFSSCRISDLDPENAGLLDATPSWHSTIIMLASHVLWQDIILPAWDAGNPDFKYAVRTYNDDRSPVQIPNLHLKFLRDIIAKFPSDQGEISIPSDEFSLNADLDGLRVVMNYQKANLGAQVRISRSNCHFSWWDIFTLGITYLIRCSVVEHSNKWMKGTLTIRSDQAARFTFRPECYSFKFDKTEVSPYVRFDIPDANSKQDIDSIHHTEQSAENGLKSLLRFRAAESKEISLFAAANIIFPSAKVLKMDNLFVTGDAIMMGDLSKDYDPDVSDLDLVHGLPAHCYT